MGSRKLVCNVSFDYHVCYELRICAGSAIFGTERENALAESSYSQIVDGYFLRLNTLCLKLDTLRYRVAQQ